MKAAKQELLRENGYDDHNGMENRRMFLNEPDNKNINVGLEKFFGRRMETRNKIEKDKGMIRHINALGGIENTFESKLFNIKSNQKK
jgi:hypothetical protein